jgi:hypothetical protein
MPKVCVIRVRGGRSTRLKVVLVVNERRGGKSLLSRRKGHHGLQ